MGANHLSTSGISGCQQNAFQRVAFNSLESCVSPTFLEAEKNKAKPNDTQGKQV